MQEIKITLILSEDNIQILTEALTNYNGKKKLIASTIIELIKRQVEIQKGKE